MIKLNDYCIIWNSCNGDKSSVRKQDFIKMLKKPNTKWRIDNKQLAIIGRTNDVLFDTSYFYLVNNRLNWNWMVQKFIELKCKKELTEMEGN